MAKNFIGLPTGANRLSNSLLGACNTLAMGRDQIRLLKEAMDQMIDGSDYTMLETAFGLSTGNGQTVYNLVAGTLADLNADVSLSSLISYLAITR